MLIVLEKTMLRYVGPQLLAASYPILTLAWKSLFYNEQGLSNLLRISKWVEIHVLYVRFDTNVGDPHLVF